MKRNSIPEEYFCGDSLYWIVHQKGMNASAQKLDALVRAMTNTNMAMLCCKVYSAAFNTPKMVVLLPNKVIKKIYYYISNTDKVNNISDQPLEIQKKRVCVYVLLFFH